MPFTLAHAAKPLILLPVEINREWPYQLALDTGNSSTFISTTLAQNLKLKTVRVSDATGAGGSFKIFMETAGSILPGNAEVKNLEVYTAGFTEMLSLAVGAKLDGVIGYNYLKIFRVMIDYPHTTLKLELSK